jgi:L-threonylcarbamoyladenylate synthase
MKVISDIRSPEVASILNTNGVVVLRTDTLYGVLARADNQSAVERVYVLKGRDETKSPIVLISDTSQLFDVVSPEVTTLTKDVWPGKVSVIIPSKDAPKWIRRDNQSVAYRLPDNLALRDLISLTGPLIAPSANPQGELPAMTIEQAVEYFGDLVDLYVDGGEVKDAAPSQLLLVRDDGSTERLR